MERDRLFACSVFRGRFGFFRCPWCRLKSCWMIHGIFFKLTSAFAATPKSPCSPLQLVYLARCWIQRIQGWVATNRPLFLPIPPEITRTGSRVLVLAPVFLSETFETVELVSSSQQFERRLRFWDFELRNFTCPLFCLLSVGNVLIYISEIRNIHSSLSATRSCFS